MAEQFEILADYLEKVGKGQGAQLTRDWAESLLKQDLITETLPVKIIDENGQVQTEVTGPFEQPRDLLKETLALLANLREPTQKERETLEKKGAIFLPVEAKSLQQVYDKNKGFFAFLNESESLRGYTPPQAFEVAVFLNKLRIDRSNNSSQAKQLLLTEEFSQKDIEPELPDAKAIMLPATGIAQIDITYQKRNNGQVLIPDFWVRALDTTFGSGVADVGRDHPDDRLSVNDWRAVDGDPRVWALPAVVFVRK